MPFRERTSQNAERLRGFCEDIMRNRREITTKAIIAEKPKKEAATARPAGVGIDF